MNWSRRKELIRPIRYLSFFDQKLIAPHARNHENRQLVLFSLQEKSFPSLPILRLSARRRFAVVEFSGILVRASADELVPLFQASVLQDAGRTPARRNLILAYLTCRFSA